ncbi:sigma-70 family RNA polymerase sigma factor [Streptosporangium subroseum]|uniref:sigma-70 family RNA polymerase sigma factor n=1 Tax=Streptosporangium subroseum TaxID=106412 RepID=UPI00352DF92F
MTIQDTTVTCSTGDAQAPVRRGSSRYGTPPYRRETGEGGAMDSEGFDRLTDPYRPELLAHCYRILGSVHDAEDLVQETYLRAWRAYDGFGGHSSLRFWLYRIATNVCLTALEHRSRRFLPAGLGAPGDDPDETSGLPGSEVEWVQPLPGPTSDSTANDPASIVVSRGSVRLALVVALQQLPPKQRVVLILRDVLAWRAAEVAELLDTTTTAVNSALQRARAHLERVAPTEDDITEPLDADHQTLLDQYVRAFENADIDTLMRVLHNDVTLEMPPEPVWFAGREAVGRFVASRIFVGPGVMRLLPVTANGQPALATYWRGEDGVFRAHAIQVLTMSENRVARMVIFREPSLFSAFGLPRDLGVAGPHDSARA